MPSFTPIDVDRLIASEWKTTTRLTLFIQFIQSIAKRFNFPSTRLKLIKFGIVPKPMEPATQRGKMEKRNMFVIKRQYRTTAFVIGDIECVVIDLLDVSNRKYLCFVWTLVVFYYLHNFERGVRAQFKHLYDSLLSIGRCIPPINRFRVQEHYSWQQ